MKVFTGRSASNLHSSRYAANSAPAQPPAEEPPKKKKSTEGLNLPPNNRHHWDEDEAKWVIGLRNVVMPLLFRREYSGLENVPKDGNYIMGPSHQNMFDAMVASDLFGSDPVGSMSAIEEFRGPIGKMLRAAGSFPVDRYGDYEGDFPNPVDHAAEILDMDRHFIFYPEGRIFADPIVYPLKTGVGRISMKSKVKYALPVAQHYSKDTQSRPLETAVGLVLSAGAGLGVYAALQSGGTWAGVVAGLLGGAVAGGVVGFLTAEKGDGARQAIRAAKWAGLGALGGAAGAGVAATASPSSLYAVAAGGLTGLAGLGATYHWTHRTIAHINVAEPIEIEPYRQRAAASSDPDAEWKEALKITADHHQRLKDAKTEITGVVSPYRMDYDGKAWMTQPDGTEVEVDQKNGRDWVPA